MIGLKKKGETKQSYQWRPDFRNKENLPEIRAVRTRVFVPIVVGGLVALLLTLIGINEYRAMTLHANIDQITGEIEKSKKQHDDIVALNSEFMKASRGIESINTYVADQLVASDFLKAVTSGLKEGMFLTRVSANEESATIEGKVLSTAEMGSTLVDDFMKELEGGDVAQGRFKDYNLASLQREDGSGDIVFRIEILNEQAKKGRKR